ncbi:MAG TPA: PTPDL family protein [Chthoniobacteraceae bacterium]|jgi:hypothetical protein|nr:PTPDL family protein [Chthoniobacteraceae bacterium]
MTLPRFAILSFVSVTFAASLLADTVVLKSGTKIEGKITKESDTEVTIETKSGGIIDEQTIKKEEVASVSKATADEMAYVALKNIKLGANSLPTPTQYDSFVTSLKAFVTQYPESSHKAEVEKLASEFEAEQKRVAGGEVKLDGKWLSKTEVERERYQINGTVAANYMKEQSTRGDAIGAMNTFDLLEKQYPGSRGYIDAVDLAKRLVVSLKQQADTRTARIPAELAEREKAVAASSGVNKMQLQAEHDREKQMNEAALAQAKRQNFRFPPFLPRNEEAMKQISSLAGQEVTRLAGIDVAKARLSLQLADQARAALDKKDITTAEEKYTAARDAWAQNEIVTRLEKEISDAKSVASNATPPPATTAEPAEADAPKEDKKAESEKTKTETTSDSAAPVAPAAGESAEEPVDESGNPLFRFMLIGIAAIVAFIAWKAYKGVRKKASEVIE